MTPAARAGYGLDALNLLVAGSQTGFGAFVAVYLTSQAWTQAHIGEALSLGTIVAMLSQLPAGALVDRARSKRVAVGVGAGAVALSALLFLWPTPLAVIAAKVLHGFASCLIGPGIAALSLALAGKAAFGERLGRNAQFSSLGSAGAALALGWVGTYVSGGAVFTVTAVLMLGGLLTLTLLPPGAPARLAAVVDRSEGYRQMLSDRRLLGFAGCVALFQLANAAMLPLVAGELTRVAGLSANLVIAACIVAPQIVVALLSPMVGRMADRFGRRPLLVIGFVALPLRGVLLAAGAFYPAMVIPVQVLDGISAAALGVLLPLVAADLTGKRGGFNRRLAVLGLAGGAGATLSTAIAGRIAQEFGISAALLALASAGAVAVGGVLLLGETNPRAGSSPNARSWRPA